MRLAKEFSYAEPIILARRQLLRGFSLEELAEESYVLFDTSALLSSMLRTGMWGTRSYTKKGLHTDSRDFFIREIKQFSKKLFITKKVRDEYLASNVFKPEKLISLFEGNDAVLDVKKIESRSYNPLWERYYWLKKRYDLSEVDYDLPISTTVLVIEGPPSDCYSLVSNDGGILEAAKIIRKTEKIKNRFRLFSRVDFNVFKELT